MQKTRIGGKIKERVFARHALIGSIFATAIFMLTFLIAPYIIAEANATNVVGATVPWNAVTLTLDTDYGNGSVGDTGHGDVDFGAITPSENSGDSKGTMRVVKKTIRVATDGTHYAVYLTMAGSTNALAISSDSNVNIPAISGTWDTPAAFTDAGWGFAVPTGTYSTNFGLPAIYSGYDALVGNDLTSTGTGSGVYNTGTWAKVPVAGTVTDPIWSAEINGSDTFDIYYAAMVDTDIMAGEYSNTIAYTAIASSQALDAVSNNLSRNVYLVGEGTTETLSLDLTASTIDFAKSQTEIYLVPHAVVAAANYTVTDAMKTAAENGDYKQCTIGEGDNDFVFANKGLKINCTMPANAVEGKADGVGAYDIWVSVAGYGYNYISKYIDADNGNAEVATVVYAGLQSTKDSAGTKPYVTTMQEMTSPVCKNTNMWGSGIGSDARIYNYEGEKLNEGTPTGTALLAAGADELKISSFALTDNRDSKTYLVRRLADGNCWMVQNLDLNLADFAGTETLTSANTDLNSKDTWNPSASLIDKVGTSTGTHSTIANTTTLDIELSTALANQYLYRGTSTSDLSSDLRRYWGSRFKDDGTMYQLTDPNNAYNADTNPCESGSSWDSSHSVCVANNINAEIPRSYDNGSDWVDQSSYATATGYTSGATVNGGYTRLAPETWDYNHATTYLGDYYNWYAATAESGTYSATSGNMEDSICPKGWRLPYNANTSGSWYDLLRNAYAVTNANGTQTESNNKYGTAQGPALAMHELPLSIVFSGNYTWVGGGLSGRGAGGYYWSSTPYAATDAHSLNFNSTYVSPQGGNTKSYGLTVRCVAR